MLKLYLVTREDLNPGQQAVQAAHAMMAFSLEHPEETRRWHDVSNTLLPNERSLQKLLAKAKLRGPCSAFYEPDRGGELTALALGPWAKGLVAKLPLALSQEPQKSERLTP